MQPTTQPKPVMDVAAPKPPASAVPPAVTAAAAAPAPAPAPTSGELPVRPAPFSASAPQQPAAPVNHAPAPQKAGSAALHQNRTPVGLITVTIFVMLVLSALAVTVYVTSKTA